MRPSSSPRWGTWVTTRLSRPRWPGSPDGPNRPVGVAAAAALIVSGAASADPMQPLLLATTNDQNGQESRSASHRAATSMTVMDITTTTLGVTMSGSTTQGIKTVLHPVTDLA